MNRKKEREIIVLSLYSMELSDNTMDDTIHYIFEQKKIEEIVSTYIYDSIEGVLAHKEEIDAVISRNLENYKIDRLSYLDLSIVRFATYELLYKSEVPTAVIINEGIEITKKYSDLGDDKAKAFNHKLMDKIRSESGR